jgi:RNA polymerase sigma-70 factor (ECF subfamily)
VNRCLQGDQLAIAELVSQYEQRIFALCYRMLGHRQDAEDVTQQSLVRVVRNLGRWDQRREFEPWLFAIAGNRCRTALSARARRSRPQSISEPIEDPAPSPHHANHLAEEIELALQALRPEYQAAFRMFHLDEASYEEIARRMDRPVGTIKTWIHRTRMALVQRLRQRGVLEGGSTEKMTDALL